MAKITIYFHTANTGTIFSYFAKLLIDCINVAKEQTTGYVHKNITMRIVIDDKIPYIRETISSLTDDAVYLRGSEIGPEDVRRADALIVRTRTRCDERLLRGSSVKFVATATIGFDHIDTGYMRRAG